MDAKTNKELTEELHSLTAYTKEYLPKQIRKAGASELPAVESTDEGKVLTVNSSGEWDAENIPSQLPAVTSSDNGSVLTVNDVGEWVPMTPPSGGSDISIVTFTLASGLTDTTTTTSATCNNTASEIEAFFENGNIVLANIQQLGSLTSDGYYKVTRAYIADLLKLGAKGFIYSANNGHLMWITVNNDGASWTVNVQHPIQYS